MHNKRKESTNRNETDISSLMYQFVQEVESKEYEAIGRMNEASGIWEWTNLLEALVPRRLGYGCMITGRDQKVSRSPVIP